jgi:hypothetical protein
LIDTINAALRTAANRLFPIINHRDKIISCPPLYPLFLDVTDRLCVIIGGGAVATFARHGGCSMPAPSACDMIAPDVSPDVPDSVRK